MSVAKCYRSMAQYVIKNRRQKGNAEYKDKMLTKIMIKCIRKHINQHANNKILGIIVGNYHLDQAVQWNVLGHKRGFVSFKNGIVYNKYSGSKKYFSFFIFSIFLLDTSDN